MTAFILGRVFQAGLGLLAATLITFAAVRLTGDPLHVILPVEATPEMYQQMAQTLGLDQPLPIQYRDYVFGLLRGDLGLSLRTQSPVSELILERLPATLQLTVAALVLGFAVAIPLGIYSAYWRGGWIDMACRLLALLGQSIPLFWLGLLLIVLFAVNLRLLPAGGSGTLAHLVLPAATLGWFVAAGALRLVRSSMLEVLQQDYILFARIKGVPESRVLWRHALRNAAIPVLTYGATLSVATLGGSVITETVFAWPGLGRLMVDAIGSRDFPVVQGVVLMLTALFIAANLVVDILYVNLNPRLRA